MSEDKKIEAADETANINQPKEDDTPAQVEDAKPAPTKAPKTTEPKSKKQKSFIKFGTHYCGSCEHTHVIGQFEHCQKCNAKL